MVTASSRKTLYGGWTGICVCQVLVVPNEFQKRIQKAIFGESLLDKQVTVMLRGRL